jgi:Uma2 family endonuclease
MGVQVVLDPFLASAEGWQIQVSARRRVTRPQYRAFCAANPELRAELTAEGELIVMAPAHTKTGSQSFELAGQLHQWAKRDGTGRGFDSSTGFNLPDGSNRSPDASWVRKSRLDALTPEQKKDYFDLCPDFVAELRSTSDRLPPLQAKMQEYIANGAQLGWLIDPFERRVSIYRPGQPVHVLEEPATVSGDPVLPGFVLDLGAIWHPDL